MAGFVAEEKASVGWNGRQRMEGRIIGVMWAIAGRMNGANEASGCELNSWKVMEHTGKETCSRSVLLS
jgi:hypothetical protein